MQCNAAFRTSRSSADTPTPSRPTRTASCSGSPALARSASTTASSGSSSATDRSSLPGYGNFDIIDSSLTHPSTSLLDHLSRILQLHMYQLTPLPALHALHALCDVFYAVPRLAACRLGLAIQAYRTATPLRGLYAARCMCSPDAGRCFAIWRFTCVHIGASGVQPALCRRRLCGAAPRNGPARPGDGRHDPDPRDGQPRARDPPPRRLHVRVPRRRQGHGDRYCTATAATILCSLSHGPFGLSATPHAPCDALCFGPVNVMLGGCWVGA